MELYEAIEKRRTVRDLQDKPIPLDILKKILNAGLKAPSNDHLRRWEFILIQEKAKRGELARFVDAPETKDGAIEIVNRWGLTDPLQRDAYIDAIPKQHTMIVNTGCLIVPCFFYEGSILKPETLSSLNPLASIWCCIENMLLAAAAEGIFGVTRIPFEEERKQLRKALKVPDNYEIPCYLSLGYPREGSTHIAQHKVCVEDRIHFNTW